MPEAAGAAERKIFVWPNNAPGDRLRKGALFFDSFYLSFAAAAFASATNEGFTAAIESVGTIS
jgi:hypothetical protein